MKPDITKLLGANGIIVGALYMVWDSGAEPYIVVSGVVGVVAIQFLLQLAALYAPSPKDKDKA